MIGRVDAIALRSELIGRKMLELFAVELANAPGLSEAEGAAACAFAAIGAAMSLLVVTGMPAADAAARIAATAAGVAEDLAE